MFTDKLLSRAMLSVDCAPWSAACGRSHAHDGGLNTAFPGQRGRRAPLALYTPEERRRRDASPWTMVQGVLAPIQFAVFLVSLGLVLRYLVTGDGLLLATVSIITKTGLLYAIMITGAIWERDVFGKYLFAPAFFWEDVVSILVLSLHTAYLVGLLSGALDAERQMWLALAAYASYVVNATQFVLKLRAARLQTAWPVGPGGLIGAPK